MGTTASAAGKQCGVYGKVACNVCAVVAAVPAGTAYSERDPIYIQQHELHLGEVIGEGASGFALEGLWNGQPVCLKVRFPGHWRSRNCFHRLCCSCLKCYSYFHWYLNVVAKLEWYAAML